MVLWRAQPCVYVARGFREVHAEVSLCSRSSTVCSTLLASESEAIGQRRAKVCFRDTHHRLAATGGAHAA